MTRKVFVLLSIILMSVGSVLAQCSVGISGPTGVVCSGDNIMLVASTSGAEPGACTQSVNMSNTTTTVTCGSSICFYDSGGPNGNYGTSESLVHTFTSNNNAPVTITFLSGTGESCCDYIYVYDGVGTSGTQLHYGILSTVNDNVSYTSTGNSLTVKFTSDGSVCYDGWEAIISCDVCSSYSYTWSNGMTGATINVSPTSSTTYTVTAEAEGCCSATASFTVNPINCVNNCNGFESASDRGEWTLVNGTETNQWVMGTGTNHGGQYALYVSSSPTASVPTNSYANTTSSVWAYYEFEFPECDDNYVLNFDWKCGGESSFDYMSMFIGPTAAVTAGTVTQPNGSVRITNPDAYSSSYANYFNTYSSYNDEWHHTEVILDNETYAGMVMRFYLLWHNDGSGQNGSAIAIDNFCIQACEPCNQPVVTVTPASVILCQGESATLTASATGGSGSGYTYTWSPETDINTTTGSTVTINPQSTTTYRVRVTDSEGCAKTVRVNAEIAGTRLNVIANPAGYCIGNNQTVTVTANLSVEGSCSSYSYAWSTGATGNSISVSPEVTTEYTVTATPADPACCELIASGIVAVMDCSADGCPSVTPAELGTNNPEIMLDCATQSDVTLCANVLATAVEADDYFVFTIPYNPPYGYTDGNRIFANASDDTWSEVVNLPFTFCYYGNTFTQVVAGANSVATFNTSVAGNSCAWSYDESIPDAALFPNTIFACYRDIYPSTSDYVASTGDGGIFEGVLGQYPCRSYKLSFNNIKLYSCTSVHTFSSMIVLYEGTNIIDIYLRDAPTCTTWNDGNGVIGLQNSDCSMGITPPGRNTGSWTAHEEAWRFMPTGQPSYHVTWYLGTDTSATTGTVLGTGDLLTVSPEVTTFYTARLQYTACNGDYFDIVNTCHVTVNNARPDLTIIASQDTICPDQEVTIRAISDSVVHYQWNTGDTTASFTIVPETYASTYICTTTYPNGCTRTDSVTVYAAAVIPAPVFKVEPGEVCAGTQSTISTEIPYSHYHWSTGSTNPSITVNPPQTTHYSLTVSDDFGCTSEGETQLIVHPIPTASFMPEQYLTFLDDGVANVHFINYSTGAENYLWDFGDPASPSDISTEQNPDHIYTTPGIYRIWLYVSSDFGCADSTSHEVSIQNPFYFYVPNAFSPDGDGINEVWLPVGTGVKEDDYDCAVYDRWGRMVFHTNSLYQPWDGTDKGGKPLPVGSYVYSIRTYTMDLVPKEYLGTVTIMK